MPALETSGGLIYATIAISPDITEDDSVLEIPTIVINQNIKYFLQLNFRGHGVKTGIGSPPFPVLI